jgi:hypothetical protein
VCPCEIGAHRSITKLRDETFSKFNNLNSGADLIYAIFSLKLFDLIDTGFS